MRTIKLAAKRLLYGKNSNVMFTLLMAILFAIINMLIGAINSQTMLYKPYEQYFEHGGYYVLTDYTDFVEEKFYTNNEQLMEGVPSQINADKLIRDKLEGSMAFTTTYIYLTKTSDENQCDVYILPDEVFDKLQLPFASGVLAAKNDEIIACPNHAVSAGDILTLSFGKIDEETGECYLTHVDLKVGGVLTDLTYVPYNGYNSNRKGMQVFFADYKKGSDKNFVIMNQSTALNSEFEPVAFSAFAYGLFYYTEEPTAEIYEKNMATLSNDFLTYDLTEISEQAESDINNAYSKFIPLAILVFIVMLIGFVCNVSLQTIRNMRIYSVYLICGSPRRHVSIINLCGAGIMILCALAICGVTILVAAQTSLFAAFGITLNSSNLLITLAMAAFCCLMAYIVPNTIIFRNSPAELIRSEQK